MTGRDRAIRRVAVVMILGVSLAPVVMAPVPAVAYPRPGSVERVSVASDGGQGNGNSEFSPAISGDGRVVAFTSFASNLVPGDGNGTWDVFVHDRTSGTIEWASESTSGGMGNGVSATPHLSTDGRFVLFRSHASDLVSDDTNASADVFVRDRQSGALQRISMGVEGEEANDSSDGYWISDDGRYVGLVSDASNLVANDYNDTRDIFVHDRQTGTNEIVTVAPQGIDPNGDSFNSSWSADGRYVAFDSSASNLVSNDTNNTRDIFVHDRLHGTTELVSLDRNGTQANGLSTSPSLSGDGRYVAFLSSATNLVPWDTNSARDVFVHDRETGLTERVSVAADGSEGDQHVSNPSISGDGRFTIFRSGASNLVPDDTNGQMDVFVHDIETGVTERVSVAGDGAEGDSSSGSLETSISDDGRSVAFDSYATNLVPGDTNGVVDVFVRERGPATGIGALSAVLQEGALSITGWATSAGRTVTTVEDPPADGGPVADEASAELSGASLVHRPEQEDLLVKLLLEELDPRDERCTISSPVFVCEQGSGVPGVVAPDLPHGRTLYGLSFELEGTRYELRARPGSSVRVQSRVLDDPALFALYRCDPSCTEQAILGGGIGTTGAEVRIAVPLDTLGISDRSTLSALRAFTAREVAGQAEPEGIDEAALPDAAIAPPRVQLGVAQTPTPEREVVYTEEADLLEGHFAAALDASMLAPGNYFLWARTCLAGICDGAHSARFDVAGDLVETSLSLEVERTRNTVVATGTLTETDRRDPIGGAEIIFSVEGQPVGSALTDSAGRAQITLSRNQFKGHDVLRATFEGDGHYATSWAERDARE